MDPAPTGGGLAPPGDERLARLPVRVKQTERWLLARWPGRIALSAASELVRIQIFDRAMTVAAQFFTSVFPVAILISGLAGRSNAYSVADQVGESTDLPPEARQVLHDPIHSGGIGAFGIVGTLIVLVSATSLARAMLRSFLTIWRLPALPSRLGGARG